MAHSQRTKIFYVTEIKYGVMCLKGLEPKNNLAHKVQQQNTAPGVSSE
jgi:hypothetical protein